MDTIENAPTIEMETGPHVISMYEDTEGMWVIRHHDEGVTTQGETVYEALFMLADALSGVNEDDLDQVRETAISVLTKGDINEHD